MSSRGRSLVRYNAYEVERLPAPSEAFRIRSALMADPRPSQMSESTETDESFVAEVSDLGGTNRRRSRRAAFWSARPLRENSLTLRQRLVRTLWMMATIVLALLVVTLSLYGLPDLHLFERQPPQPLTVQVDTGAISFLLDMTWSPDSK